jgi:hypothetical protein
VWDWFSGVAEWEEVEPDQQEMLRQLSEIDFHATETIDDQVRQSLEGECGLNSGLNERVEAYSRSSGLWTPAGPRFRTWV